MTQDDTHECPAPDCAARVSRDMLACRKHWYSIPKPLRDELWAAFDCSGMGSERHSAAVQACCDYLDGAAA